jgi:hypothetical protein
MIFFDRPTNQLSHPHTRFSLFEKKSCKSTCLFVAHLRYIFFSIKIKEKTR